MDVAKIMELYLQKEITAINSIFLKKLLIIRVICAAGNRRGLVLINHNWVQKVLHVVVSMTSFGHTGYTGTMAWADAEKQIVYVFLSNRTFPVATENKLSKENIREDIQKFMKQLWTKLILSH
jgi:CubicO group peptidase (beta-lactamase class C family)